MELVSPIWPPRIANCSHLRHALLYGSSNKTGFESEQERNFFQFRQKVVFLPSTQQPWWKATANSSPLCQKCCWLSSECLGVYVCLFSLHTHTHTHICTHAHTPKHTLTVFLSSFGFSNNSWSLDWLKFRSADLTPLSVQHSHTRTLSLSLLLARTLLHTLAHAHNRTHRYACTFTHSWSNDRPRRVFNVKEFCFSWPKNIFVFVGTKTSLKSLAMKNDFLFLFLTFVDLGPAPRNFF